MKNLLEVCLIAFALTGIPTLAAAQMSNMPMQHGISVELPTTSQAVALPEADRQDALIVTVDYDGSVYLGTERTDVFGLGEKIASKLADQPEKKLYIKADARSRYADVVSVLERLRAAGVKAIALLTEQHDSRTSGGLEPPKGLEMLLPSP
ncbi:MAG TPA: biopolymer transporter ExbD [Terriglobales bacterium]|jgi:biopolymer transport protein ExbD